MNSAHTVTVNLNGLSVNDGNYTTLQLSSLPEYETFESHSQNALKVNLVAVSSNSLTITLPALSTTAILLKTTPAGFKEIKNSADKIKIFPNPVSDKLNVLMISGVAENAEITIYDQSGRSILSSKKFYDGTSQITLDISAIPVGYYFLSVKTSHYSLTRSFTVIR
jgi:hypothetical protein